ncbi:hypothetical protein PR003_g16425 [Phytophthora rubi]|uniref:Uncharacterized protein n=1 Tax=Phytophthora rubi TaxID=129364 RepID=A0A6A4EZ50_9STRA|nr:hypothetical protein PR003_g16425 [Phytophthora rubi]
MATCCWPAASSVRQRGGVRVEAGGGVHAQARQPAAGQQQAVSASVAEAGDGVHARAWQASAAQQQGAWLLVTCMAEMEVLMIAMQHCLFFLKKQHCLFF